MPVPLSQTAARWRAALAGERPVTGMWVASGSPVVAEICAGSGVDWLLIDSEHAPNDLRSILAQLHAVASYPVTPVVRPPVGDPVLIKQLLDLGVEVLLIPMVESAAQARALVAATRYPPDGIRGVGSALARASRWNRVGAALYVNEAIEETGLAAGVLGHPANGVAWLANKLAPYDEHLEPGQVILAGSFTRPVFVGAGDTVHADFGDLGAVTCRFR